MRWTRSSSGALLALGALYLCVGVSYRELVDTSAPMDWLLLGIWVVMTGAVAYGFDPRHDLRLAGVALVGGAIIETWGTTTQLWTYFTHERPPPWILPAWPVAALTIDRFARPLLRRGTLNRWTGLSSPLLLLFVAAMIRFSWPYIDVPTTPVVWVLMAGVVVWRPDPRSDLAHFLVGVVAGLFLETWGTSRHCWTYYTRELPPWEAVVAHGFAAVAFLRLRTGFEAAAVVVDRLAGERWSRVRLLS